MIVTNARALLLDTCAVIRLGNGSLGQQAIEDITYAALADGVYVSPVSAWEIGLLADPTRGSKALSFLPDAQRWFDRLMRKTVISPAPFTNEIAIGSSQLPGEFHRDPADRLLTATARARSFAIMTSDHRILEYAAAGYVEAVKL